MAIVVRILCRHIWEVDPRRRVALKEAPEKRGSLSEGSRGRESMDEFGSVVGIVWHRRRARTEITVEKKKLKLSKQMKLQCPNMLRLFLVKSCINSQAWVFDTLDPF